MYQDPELKKAFIKYVKYYFKNNSIKEYDKAAGQRKYDKKYLDNLDLELFPVESKKEKKKIKKELNSDE